MKKLEQTPSLSAILLISILIVGLFFRFSLAKIPHRSDVGGFVIDAQLFREGKNVYLYQKYYNYSPFFFYVLGWLDKIQQVLPDFPLYYIIQCFLSVIDVITALILIGLERQRKKPVLPAVIFFLLNPVSIIITGYHGQFDNIAIMFLLLGVYLYRTNLPLSRFLKTALVWSVLTLGLIIKHTIIFPVYIFWNHYFRNILKSSLVFLGSLLIFFLSFLPYWSSAKNQIIEQVFKYRSMEGLYGISYLLDHYCRWCKNFDYGLISRNLFLAGFLLFAVLIKTRDVARSLLLGFLFFLTFTTGIGGQYFVFPVALGALFPSFWFFLYTVIVTLFLLGNFWEFNLPAFSIFSWNAVWVVTCLWFIYELIEDFKPCKS